MALKALAPLNLAQSLSEPDLSPGAVIPSASGQAASWCLPLGAGSTPGTRTARLFAVRPQSDLRAGRQQRSRSSPAEHPGPGGHTRSETEAPGRRERQPLRCLPDWQRVQFHGSGGLREGQTVTLLGLIPKPPGPVPPKEEVIPLVTPNSSHPWKTRAAKRGTAWVAEGNNLTPAPTSSGPADLEFYLLQGRSAANPERGGAKPGRKKQFPGSQLPGPSLADPAQMLRYSRCEEALICGPHGCRKSCSHWSLVISH